MHTHCSLGAMYLDMSGSPLSPDIENRGRSLVTHCHICVLCQYCCRYLYSTHVFEVQLHLHTYMCTFYIYIYICSSSTHLPTLYYNILCMYFICTLSDMQITLLLDMKSCIHPDLVFHMVSTIAPLSLAA